MHQLLVRVHGRVQGVGFRWFVAERAGELALNGTVRNDPDGSVEVQAEGDPQALDQFVEALRRGPPNAKVAVLQVHRSEGPQRFKSFRVE